VIGQWADAAPQHTLARLGCRITAPTLGVRIDPSAATLLRVLLAVVPEALAALSRPGTLHAVVVDGKSLSGLASRGFPRRLG